LTLARLRAVIAMALCCQLRDAPPAGFFGGGDECTEQAQPIGLGAVVVLGMPLDAEIPAVETRYPVRRNQTLRLRA